MHRKYSQNISETVPTITNCAFNYAYFAYGSLYFLHVDAFYDNQNE